MKIGARRPGVNGNWSKATGDEQDSGGNYPDSFWLVNYVYIFCFHVKNYTSSKCLPKSGGKNIDLPFLNVGISVIFYQLLLTWVLSILFYFRIVHFLQEKKSWGLFLFSIHVCNSSLDNEIFSAISWQSPVLIH
jgi:hypothetical protein